MKTLILYFTTDGQTKKIAERLADVITHEVELISLKDQAVDFAEKIANADQIVIGASIRYGHFNPLVYQFVEQHYPALNAKKTAFYGVNLTARKDNRNTPETNTYVRKFLAKVKWKPTHIEVIAGALLYLRYKPFDRLMIRFIMKITKGETDTSKEYEYTDWQQVENFGK
ncbi:TPA: menaquinone-dependent protoporphyrinogen IX dehydrogenase, partial [Mannheimia haemolytica]|nr:menaquinone-dependent protoporphyrinogen IX dehydrogenase [Mannheimia haemolytica]HDL5264908.1 menaquinone-dependent protoporphyrinogen IX dehydrogenase [Mannheimia haemolytica]HDL5661717.1 menaquinone-dependent protoporphyrinogen IX dehydrogenase [Mannheimia haemolytica]HDL5897989.1 menaquinone-dependent protoporphyrinogen IX dehydrogenase [Mannheimia haemolytica]